MKGKEHLNSHHAAGMVRAVNCCSTGLVSAAVLGFRQDRMHTAFGSRKAMESCQIHNKETHESWHAENIQLYVN